MADTPNILDHATPIGPNRYMITVGNGGYYSSINSAVAERALFTQTLLETKNATASSTGGLSGRQINLSVPLSSTYSNRILLFRIGTGAYFFGRVLTTSTVICKQPIAAPFANQDISVYDPNFVNIFITPGSVINVPNQIPAIPSCTAISGISKSHLIRAGYATNNSAIFIFDSNTTGIMFDGVTIGARENAQAQQSIKFGSASANGELTEFAIKNCDIYNAAFDCIYMPDALTGYVKIANNEIYGLYDCIRASQAAQLDITNNTIIAIDDGNYGIAACVAFDSIANNNTNVNIRGNTLVAESEIAGGIIIPVDIRNAGNLTKINVSHNHIKAYAGGAASIVGVGGYTANLNTAKIQVSSNIFDCNHSGTALTVFTIDNINPTYTYSRAGNIAIPGSVATVGLNTTIAVTF